MRAYLEENCEGIDAAIFNGDVLYDATEREELKVYVERWARMIAEHEDAEHEGAEPDREAIKQRAYVIDPECWVSYSGKEKKFKQHMDARRTASMQRAERELRGLA